MKIFSINTHSIKEIAVEAKEILQLGGIIAYPTDTLYGLGVDATNEKAIQKLYDLKGRENVPMSVMLSDVQMIPKYITGLTAEKKQLIAKFLPGALTIVGDSNYNFSSLLYGEKTSIGIRVPHHELSQTLVRVFGYPITTTSANLTGQPPALQIERILSYFHDKIDMIIDGGVLKSSPGSTVVDIRNEKPLVLREGVISQQEIQNYMDKLYV